MYTIMEAHPITVIVVVSSMMLVPFFVLATYAFSGASLKKGALIGAGFLLWGGVMAWVCLSKLPASFGPLGAMIVPVCWFTPVVILFLFRSWFLDKPLSQHLLISLQLWRAIGAVFLLEMTRGNIPGIFAYPAGVGDLGVALAAGVTLVRYRRSDSIPSGPLLFIIVFGMADFFSAFFFGFTSSVGPQQLFFPEVANNTLLFPTGMIPLFLVPCAIFFHGLSWLTLRRD